MLGRFIPEFGKIVSMMQFNMYHHYTVDEHLIRTVDVLSEIDKGRAEDVHPLVNKLMPGIEDRDALYVAVLLHDIAKGREEDHSEAGAKVARKLGPRFGLSPKQTELVVWLIEEHLTMSMVAQTRDLTDRKTIIDFADRVQSLDRLKMLLILTVCDIRAVGPGVWNGWKGQLLRTLYVRDRTAACRRFFRGVAQRTGGSRSQSARKGAGGLEPEGPQGLRQAALPALSFVRPAGRSDSAIRNSFARPTNRARSWRPWCAPTVSMPSRKSPCSHQTIRAF